MKPVFTLSARFFRGQAVDVVEYLGSLGAMVTMESGSIRIYTKRDNVAQAVTDWAVAAGVSLSQPKRASPAWLVKCMNGPEF